MPKDYEKNFFWRRKSTDKKQSAPSTPVKEKLGGSSVAYAIATTGRKKTTTAVSVNAMREELTVDLKYAAQILSQRWQPLNQNNFLSQLSEMNQLFKERVEAASPSRSMSTTQRNIATVSYERLLEAHQRFSDWLTGFSPGADAEQGVDTSGGQELVKALRESANTFFDDMDRAAKTPSRHKSLVGVLACDGERRPDDILPNVPMPRIRSNLTAEDKALVERMQELESEITPPPKPPMPPNGPLSQYLDELANNPDVVSSGDRSSLDYLPMYDLQSKPRSNTLPSEMQGRDAAQFVQGAIEFRRQVTEKSLPSPAPPGCSPRQGDWTESPHLPRNQLRKDSAPCKRGSATSSWSSVDSRRRVSETSATSSCKSGKSMSSHLMQLIEPPVELSENERPPEIDNVDDVLDEKDMQEEIAAATRRMQEGMVNEEEVPRRRKHRRSRHAGPLDAVKSGVASSEGESGSGDSRSVSSGEEEDELSQLRQGPICKSEVRSDEEEKEEIFVVNGKKYRQRYTRRIVVERHTVKQDVPTLVTAPALPDGSGPAVDIDLVDSGGPPGSAPVAMVVVARDAQEVEDDGAFESEPEKPPAPSSNVSKYMYSFGATEYKDPVLDKRLSTQLFDLFRTQWHKTDNVRTPNERSRTISYVERYSQPTASGGVVHRSTCVQQTRTVRLVKSCSDQELYVFMRNSQSSSKDIPAIEAGPSTLGIPASNQESTSMPAIPTGVSESVYESLTGAGGPVIGTPDSDRGYATSSSRGSWSSILEEVDYRPYLIFMEEKPATPDSQEISIRGGPIDALIVYATSIGKKDFDYLFCETFLTTYRTFITPEELVEKLVARYSFFRSGGGDVNEADRNKVCTTVTSFLVNVVSQLRRDMSSSLLDRLTTFAEQLKNDDQERLSMLVRDTACAQLALKKELQQTSLPKSVPLAARKVTTRPTCLLDLSSRVVAEQMTLLEAEKFDRIGVEELLDIKAVERERNPTLTACVTHFNMVNNWAKTLILSDERKSASDRERYMLKVFEIMENLHSLRNFSSYLALLCALFYIPDALLTKRIKSKLEPLRPYMTPPSFVQYRREFEEAAIPCIPYLGIIFQHLILLAEGNRPYLDSLEACPGLPVVNFWRCWKHFLIISFFVRKNKTDNDKARYKIHPHEEVLAFLNNFHDHLSDSSLDALAIKYSQSARNARKD